MLQKDKRSKTAVPFLMFIGAKVWNAGEADIA